MPVQALMHSYDEFCFSLSRFVPAGIYRILELRFPERVSLHEIEDSHDDLQLLYRHAIEQSHLLGFVRIMNRAVWAEDNILAKRHFLEKIPASGRPKLRACHCLIIHVQSTGCFGNRNWCWTGSVTIFIIPVSVWRWWR